MIDILADANATIVMTEEVFTQQTELLKATYKPLQAGLGCLGAAIGVGLVGMKAAEAVGRNPDASSLSVGTLSVILSLSKVTTTSSNSWPAIVSSPIPWT